MKAFDAFVRDFYKEYTRLPKKSDFDTLITPYRVREMKKDDFDGRSTNNFKHLRA